tara:strand:- start:2214 stop:2807 length:594 start_codon:yes stop_codon:yes gene_type:complete
MSYQVERVFSTPIYRSAVNDIDNIQEQLSKAVNDTTFTTNDNWGMTHFLSENYGDVNFHEEYDLSAFVSELDVHVKRYCSEIKFPFRKYRISSSWIALFESGNYGHVHNHGSSDMSGTYYYQRDDDGLKDGNIFFESPVYNAETSLCFRGSTSGRVMVPATTGSILLFPGWLKHGIMTNETEHDRVSFSFDIIFDRH